MPKIDIVIPHFGDRKLLETNLPLVVKLSTQINKIIIIDDTGISDLNSFGSLSRKITIITNPKNLGFTQSVNIGFKHSSADFVVLLNNDVYPEKNYIIETLNYFTDPKVFAVNFNETHSSWPVVSWSGGKLQFTRSEDKSKAVYTAWASGGSAMFRKTIWDELGGFDEVFSPGYWEDIDIGWRAWKSGYKIIWQPEGMVVHHHESTFNKLNPSFVNLIKERNELLFTWKNINHKKLIANHLQFLVSYSITHPGFLKVIFAALAKKTLCRPMPVGVITDLEILSIINQPV